MTRSTTFQKSRRIVFDQADAEEFSAVLRREYPNIRFLPHMLENWLDADAGFDAPLPYLESLAAPETDVLQAWLEPPGWKPVLLPVPTFRGEELALFNAPTLRFHFDRSSPALSSVILNDATFMDMSEGDLWARIGKTDREHQRFVGKVFRIVEKMSTRVFDVDSPKTGERRQAVRTATYAGPSAVRWAAGSPDRRLDGDLRPVGSVDAPCPPRPYEEVYGPELAARLREFERSEEERRQRREARLKAKREAAGE